MGLNKPGRRGGRPLGGGLVDLGSTSGVDLGVDLGDSPLWPEVLICGLTESKVYKWFPRPARPTAFDPPGYSNPQVNEVKAFGDDEYRRSHFGDIADCPRSEPDVSHGSGREVAFQTRYEGR